MNVALIGMEDEKKKTLVITSLGERRIDMAEGV